MGASWLLGWYLGSGLVDSLPSAEGPALGAYAIPRACVSVENSESAALVVVPGGNPRREYGIITMSESAASPSSAR